MAGGGDKGPRVRGHGGGGPRPWRNRRKKDDDDRKKRKPPKKKDDDDRRKHRGPVSESLKAKSHQSGNDAMQAVPGSYPAEPANAEAVYTTGPGQAVEYNYTRQGTYADQYAEQSNEQNAVTVQGNPVAGVGGGARGAPPEWFGGASNNPT